MIDGIVINVCAGSVGESIAKSCYRANTHGVQFRKTTAHNIIVFYNELRSPYGSANFKGEGYESFTGHQDKLLKLMIGPGTTNKNRDTGV